MFDNIVQGILGKKIKNALPYKGKGDGKEKEYGKKYYEGPPPPPEEKPKKEKKKKN